MPDPFANGHAQPPEDGWPADDTAVNATDTATLAALRRLATVPPPRRAFARSLKEELMHAPTALATPWSPAVPWSAPRSQVATEPTGEPRRGRGLNAFATAVLLLLVTAAAVSLTVARLGGDRPTPTTAAFAAATPDTQSDIDPRLSEACPTFLTCPGAVAMVWPGFAYAPGVDIASFDARNVQLQGWMLDPGATFTPPAAGSGDPQGVVVDFVVSGTYSATFDVPIMLTQLGGSSGQSRVRYIDPGTPVEVGRGESVSYQLGGLTDLSNPLRQRHLHFKRAVLYRGDATATQANDAAGVTMRVNGDGRLPQALDEQNQNISLLFVNIPPGAAFPPEEWEKTVIIGPVNAETAPEGAQGYVLRAGYSAG